MFGRRRNLSVLDLNEIEMEFNCIFTFHLSEFSANLVLHLNTISSVINNAISDEHFFLKYQ